MNKNRSQFPKERKDGKKREMAKLWEFSNKLKTRFQVPRDLAYKKETHRKHINSMDYLTLIEERLWNRLSMIFKCGKKRLDILTIS